MPTSGIYAIQNKVTGHRYIGSAQKLSERRHQHFRDLRRGCHHNTYLQHAWNRYGEEAFEFIVLMRCDEAELLMREQQFLDDRKPEYNIARIADAPMKGRKHTEETKAKMSLVQRGKKHAPTPAEALKRMAETKRGKRNPHPGYPRSESTRRKMSESHTGKPHPHSDEQRRKQSESHKRSPRAQKQLREMLAARRARARSLEDGTRTMEVESGN